MGLTYASDSVAVDTSQAPWMEIAQDQRRKGIREHNDYATFKSMLAREFVGARCEVSLDPPPEPEPETMSRWDPMKWDSYEAAARREVHAKNAPIAKYMATVGTDPLRDPKGRGRSWKLAPIVETSAGWRITPWCAAFVNWCLKQAGAPHLGIATADAWLRFGTPLPAPVYGCVVVTRPSSSTGSSTGHVAFFTRLEGNRIRLLGGNQSDAVKESSYPVSWVRGYRWPTSFNHLLTSNRIA